MSGVDDHRAVVLVDANVIIECHRTGTWGAFAGGYRVETVNEDSRSSGADEQGSPDQMVGFRRERAQEALPFRVWLGDITYDYGTGYFRVGHS